MSIDGRFTTSAYYAEILPDWVNRFNARRIPFSYAGATWSLLLPEASYPEPDSVLYENFGSPDVRFPHRYPADSLRSAERGVLLITHYQRLLDHIVPDQVHVLARGRIAKSGDKTLAHELEKRGYDWVLEVA